MERNPHHPTTKAMHGQWHKLLAATMLKLDHPHIILSAEDITRMAASGMNIMVVGLKDGIHLRLVDDEAAKKMAILQGGISDANHN
jgi:hypothetical protein